MSVREPDFVNEVFNVLRIHSWKAPSEVSAELTAITTALAADVTTHDRTIDAPAAGSVLVLAEPNLIAAPTAGWKTRFGNDMILIINQAKAGNLSNASIIAAIDHAIGVASKPGLIDIPYASLTSAPPPVAGSTVSCTQGNWDGTPTSYTYQWKRDGVTNIGTTNSPTAPYTLVAGDVAAPGHQITCVVTAINAQGSTVAPASNIIQT